MACKLFANTKSSPSSNCCIFSFALQVLYEITEGKLGVLEPPPTTPAEPSKSRDQPSSSKAHEEEEEEEEEEDLTEMQSRLEALKS